MRTGKISLEFSIAIAIVQSHNKEMEMSKLIRKLLNAIAPITICADWLDGVTLHRCWSRQEALEWAACYPADAVILFRNRSGAVIAWRA